MRAKFAVHRRATRAGFTLIEILAVVVILGIISAVILPQLGSRDDQKAVSGARVMVADIMYAQNRAIATQKTHYVKFDTATMNYTVLDAWPSGVIKHPVSGANYVVKFGPGTELKDCALASASFDGTSVLAFDAMGVPYSYDSGTNNLVALNAGEAVVRAGTFKMTVSVAPFSGEVTLK